MKQPVFDDMKIIFVMIALAASVPGILPAKTNAFEVYCVPSLDGVSTCQGWRGDQILNCVTSSGNVSSCRSSIGEEVTCIQEPGNITTCRDKSEITKIKKGGSSACTSIGNGSYTCDEKDSPAKTSIITGDEEIIEIVGRESTNLDLSIPSEIE